MSESTAELDRSASRARVFDPFMVSETALDLSYAYGRTRRPENLSQLVRSTSGPTELLQLLSDRERLRKLMPNPIFDERERQQLLARLEFFSVVESELNKLEHEGFIVEANAERRAFRTCSVKSFAELKKRLSRAAICRATLRRGICRHCGKPYFFKPSCELAIACACCASIAFHDKIDTLELACGVAKLDHRRRAKYLSFTVAAYGDSPQERVLLFKAMFPRFLRKLREQVGRFECVWFMEWTPGADGKGHPHVHMLIFSDFIKAKGQRSWLHDALKSAMTAAGYPNDVAGAVNAPVLKAVHTTRDLNRYLADGVIAYDIRRDPSVLARAMIVLDRLQSHRASEDLGKAIESERRTRPARCRHG